MFVKENPDRKKKRGRLYGFLMQESKFSDLKINRTHKKCSKEIYVHYVKNGYCTSKFEIQNEIDLEVCTSVT